MKTLYKTLLLTTAAVCIAGGGAMAEGTTSTDQSYNNTSPSTTDGDQQTNIEPGNFNSPNRSDHGMDRSADANVDANAGMQQSAGLSNDQIQNAQESLRNEGHSLSVDGIWGPQTAQAVRQFQQENGLDVTGSLDSETLAALDVDANAGTSNNNMNMDTETGTSTGSDTGSTYPTSE